MSKLAEDTSPKQIPILLTDKRDVQFELSFKYPLKKGFTFKNLEKKNLIELQRFLDKIARMTVQQVDKAFARQPDKNDTFNNKQVLHYEVAKSFRIHAVFEDGRYVVIRIDPNHRVHG